VTAPEGFTFQIASFNSFLARNLNFNLKSPKSPIPITYFATRNGVLIVRKVSKRSSDAVERA
jgi:hypothetical protein